MTHTGRTFTAFTAFCLLAAGTVAAAGAKPAASSLDKAFAQLARFTYGKSREPLFAIESRIRQVASDPKQLRPLADRLTALLQQPGTPFAAKQFICMQLGRIGSDAHVPTLAKMLDDARTTEIARRALQTVPGDAAGDALRAALARLRGDARVGAINALGERRDAKAVAPLAKLLAGPSRMASAAAVRALGKIATAAAAAALAEAEPRARPDLRSAICLARLRCADGLAARGDAARAAPIYQELLSPKRPVHIRAAALAGLVKARKAKAAPLLLEALGAKEPRLRAAAARLASQVPGEAITRVLVARLAKLDAKASVLLINTLAERGDPAARPAVSSLLGSSDEGVKVAAIRALGRLGEVSSVGSLIAIAATTGAPQAAARATLARIAGPGVDDAILGFASKGAALPRIEAIRALAARRTPRAAPTLLAAASDADQRVRLAALAALSVLATEEHYGQLIRLLVAAPSVADMEAAARVVASAGARIEPVARRVQPILEAMKTAPAERKAPLLRILGRSRAPEALAVLRSALSGPDAAVRDVAVRALVEWPSDEAADDLLRLARAAESPVHRVLAMRGYLRLAQAGTKRPAPDTLKMLERAAPLLKTPQEKRSLLAAASTLALPAALKLATSFLNDADARAEAALATLTIAEATVGGDPAAVAAAVQTLLGAKPGEDVAARARLILRRTKGSVPLFDGKTLAGWTKPFDWGSATVEDGVIHLQGDKKFFLATEKTYGDFIFEAEARLDEGANSGIQFRSHFAHNRLWGYQADVDSLARGWRGLYDETPGRGWLDRGDAKKAEALYRKGWNEHRIECIGTHIRIFMNGQLIVDHVDPLEIDGHFALQHHGEKGKVCRFRNIRINDLGRRKWLPLLDAKTLAKWRSNGLGKWAVEDGVIVGRRQGGSGHGMLFSPREVGDFAIRFQYKAVAGNCGFYLRSEKLAGHAGARGLQVEIDPAKDNSGLYETHGRNWVAKPNPNTHFKRGQWNDVAVTAIGRRIVVHLNNHRTVDLPNDPGRTKGYFALGLHSGNSHVLFKDIQILSDPAP